MLYKYNIKSNLIYFIYMSKSINTTKSNADINSEDKKNDIFFLKPSQFDVLMGKLKKLEQIDMKLEEIDEKLNKLDKLDKINNKIDKYDDIKEGDREKIDLIIEIINKMFE